MNYQALVESSLYFLRPFHVNLDILRKKYLEKSIIAYAIMIDMRYKISEMRIGSTFRDIISILTFDFQKFIFLPKELISFRKNDRHADHKREMDNILKRLNSGHKLADGQLQYLNSSLKIFGEFIENNLNFIKNSFDKSFDDTNFNEKLLSKPKIYNDKFMMRVLKFIDRNKKNNFKTLRKQFFMDISNVQQNFAAASINLSNSPLISQIPELMELKNAISQYSYEINLLYFWIMIYNPSRKADMFEYGNKNLMLKIHERFHDLSILFERIFMDRILEIEDKYDVEFDFDIEFSDEFETSNDDEIIKKDKNDLKGKIEKSKNSKDKKTYNDILKKDKSLEKIRDMQDKLKHLFFEQKTSHNPSEMMSLSFGYTSFFYMIDISIRLKIEQVIKWLYIYENTLIDYNPLGRPDYYHLIRNLIQEKINDAQNIINTAESIISFRSQNMPSSSSSVLPEDPLEDIKMIHQQMVGPGGYLAKIGKLKYDLGKIYDNDIDILNDHNLTETINGMIETMVIYEKILSRPFTPMPVGDPRNRSWEVLDRDIDNTIIAYRRYIEAYKKSPYLVSKKKYESARRLVFVDNTDNQPTSSSSYTEYVEDYTLSPSNLIDDDEIQPRFEKESEFSVDTSIFDDSLTTSNTSFVTFEEIDNTAKSIEELTEEEKNLILEIYNTDDIRIAYPKYLSDVNSINANYADTSFVSSYSSQKRSPSNDDIDIYSKRSRPDGKKEEKEMSRIIQFMYEPPRFYRPDEIKLFSSIYHRCIHKRNLDKARADFEEEYGKYNVPGGIEKQIQENDLRNIDIYTSLDPENEQYVISLKRGFRISTEYMYILLTKRLINEPLPNGIKNLLIVDARWDYEYKKGHVRGAIHVPIISDIKSFFWDKTTGKPIYDSNTAIIMYCEFSHARSLTVYKTIVDNDLDIHYKNIYILDGGYNLFFKHRILHLKSQSFYFEPKIKYKTEGMNPNKKRYQVKEEYWDLYNEMQKKSQITTKQPRSRSRLTDSARLRQSLFSSSSASSSSMELPFSSYTSSPLQMESTMDEYTISNIPSSSSSYYIDTVDEPIDFSFGDISPIKTTP